MTPEPGTIMRGPHDHRVVVVSPFPVPGAPLHFYGEPLPPFSDGHPPLGEDIEIGDMVLHVEQHAYLLTEWTPDE